MTTENSIDLRAASYLHKFIWPVRLHVIPSMDSWCHPFGLWASGPTGILVGIKHSWDEPGQSVRIPWHLIKEAMREEGIDPNG